MPGCVTTLGQALGTMDYVALAQADLAAKHLPKGLSANNFHQVPFVAFNRKDNLQHGFVMKALGLPRVILKQLFVPSSEGRVRAVQAGLGVTVSPEQRVKDLVE